MLLEKIIELEVIALLLRVVIINNFLAILTPLTISSAHERLHTYFV